MSIKQNKPRPLVCFDIVDKLRDLEAEFACQILDELITNYTDVQNYLICNHSDILEEE